MRLSASSTSTLLSALRRTLSSQHLGSPRPAQAVSATAAFVAKMGRLSLLVGVVLIFSVPAAGAARTKGELEIRVVDANTKQPIAARMHLKNSRGRAINPRNLPSWNDHFVFADKVVLELVPGDYTYELERGPEYRQVTGHFSIKRGAADNTEIEMPRIVDLSQEGWWSGDLHIHRAPADIPLLMLAEDLHVAPVITWWNANRAYAEGQLPDPALKQFDENRFYHLLAGEDERGGGALLYFNLSKPLPLVDGQQREYPPMAKFLRMAHQQDTSNQLHVDIEKPFWWDMPLWISMEMCDSIGLANNHLLRAGMLPNEAWGKPRDPDFYPNPLGNGIWSQDIYHHLLNCGVRIPPSAGSASGVLDNPVGYNRVYVHCDGPLTYEKWWEGLRSGRVFVTNGPLLRPRVNGQLPGHVFSAPAGDTIELSTQLNLATRDRIEYLEIIKNGKLVHEVRLSDYAKRRGKLPIVEFKKSGWMLIRAVTTETDTYRFASTGPYYVEIGGEQTVSRKSAQFFVDWTGERVKQLEQLPDAEQRREILSDWDRARTFWQDRLDRANAD
jgi:hypothetical protein